MKQDSIYEEERVNLQAGDVLFLLTDGYTEAMSEQKEPLGPERIQQLLSNPDLEALSAEHLIEYLLQYIQLHVGTGFQHDDMTVVVVKVLS
jgi:sigma-B regulation protein RsbU (phosphoserine phosphatase)